MRYILSLAGSAVLLAGSAAAECAIENSVPLRSLTNSFEAWKVVTDEMGECGNFTAVLDNEFRQKQAPAFAASPPLYQIGGVADGDFTPLIQQNLVRPLDDLVERYGDQLRPNQFIQIDGQIMAIAMMINNQHLMYRADILADLGLDVPTTYDELLTAAAIIEEAGVVDYPLGATYMAGWNLAKELTNMYLAMGGSLFNEDDTPSIANETGIAAIEMMKAVTEYLDPEYLVSDSTYVQQQFQQGKIAMANFWASRAAAVMNPEESEYAYHIKMAAAPAAVEGGPPAATVSWNGIVLPRNLDPEAAEIAFQVALEGIDAETAREHPDAAVWLIDGYEPTPAAEGAIATAGAGAAPMPASVPYGLMHDAVGNNLAEFLTGRLDAMATLERIEEAYLVSAREAGVVD